MKYNRPVLNGPFSEGVKHKSVLSKSVFLV